MQSFQRFVWNLFSQSCLFHEQLFINLQCELCLQFSLRVHKMFQPLLLFLPRKLWGSVFLWICRGGCWSDLSLVRIYQTFKALATKCTLGELILTVFSVGSWTCVSHGCFLFFSGWVCQWCPAGSREVPILPQGADGCVWKPSALAHCGKRGNRAAVAGILDLSAWMLVVSEHNSIHLWDLLFPCCSLWTEAESNEKKIKSTQVT